MARSIKTVNTLDLSIVL